MKPIKLFLLVSILLSSWSITAQLPVETNSKTSEVDSFQDVAVVYVYRKSVFALAIGLPVALNKTELATFFPKRYYKCVLDPGSYVFRCFGENMDEVTINAEVGQTYYIEVVPKMGVMMPRCDLRLMDAKVGKARMKSCKEIGKSDAATKQPEMTPSKN